MVKKQRLKTFSPEAVLKAFTVECLREDACQDYILQTLHPDGAHCPACGMRLEDETSIENFWKLRRCECKICGKWFSATTGTILHNSQLDMRQFFVPGKNLKTRHNAGTIRAHMPYGLNNIKEL